MDNSLLALVCYGYEYVNNKLREGQELADPRSLPVRFMRNWVAKTQEVPDTFPDEGWEAFIRLAWAVAYRRPIGELRAQALGLAKFGVFSAEEWGRRATLYSEMIIPGLLKVDSLARDIGPCI